MTDIKYPTGIAVAPETPELHQEAARIATEFGLAQMDVPSAGHPFILTVTPARLELRETGINAAGAIYVDFAGGTAEHRRRFGGGRGQPLARAIGLRGGATPTVLDATAGLGRDAFVLACLGCKVHLLERSPVASALLQDGLKRASTDPEIGAMVRERMTLSFGDGLVFMNQISELARPEVVYLDPMYPPRTKSAMVKKEMRAFHTLIGKDEDVPALLEAALKCARKRVVVKRPRLAETIDGPKPSISIESKNTRFDVYLIMRNT